MTKPSMELEADVDELKRKLDQTNMQVNLLTVAIFGDMNDIKAKPGMYAELRKLEEHQVQMNATLTNILTWVQWGVLGIIGSVGGAVLAMVLKG